MSGETKQEVSGWTVDTLRSSLLDRIRTQDEKVLQMFADRDRAVQVAIVQADEAKDLLAKIAEDRFTAQERVTAALAESDEHYRTAISSQLAAITERLHKQDGGEDHDSRVREMHSQRRMILALLGSGLLASLVTVVFQLILHGA